MATTGAAAAERVQAMLDEWDCLKLQQQYWYAESLRDPDLFTAVFTEDATCGPVTGHDAIRALAASFMGEGSILASLLHRYAPAPVLVDFEVDGDTARGKVFGMSYHHYRSSDGVDRMRIVSSGYDNEYARTPDGWRIKRMSGIDEPDTLHDTYWRFEGDTATGPLGSH
jgi:hypothetical protein